MGYLFKRKVEVEIKGQNSTKKISGLKISFSVSKNNEATPNDAEIKIYNLSDETRKSLDGENISIELKAGYEGLNGDGGNIETIFIGNVKKVTQEIQKPDIITSITAGDGEKKYRNKRHTKGYPEGTKLKTVVQDITKSLDLGKGSLDAIPDITYNSGVTLQGLCRDHLDNIARSNDLEWSIQDEKLQIIKRDGFTKDSVLVISPTSGLIGSPNKTKKGVEFTSLLQPQLKIGRKVEIKSRFISGKFKIRKVTHEGDSREGDFVSKCEATEK